MRKILCAVWREPQRAHRVFLFIYLFSACISLNRCDSGEGDFLAFFALRQQ
ncbi:MAG: hypothetical protein IJT30_11105 [Muribaculaceae bacterium]|nr:hypothetical protein [Muribaculaceae bacterium]